MKQFLLDGRKITTAAILLVFSSIVFLSCMESPMDPIAPSSEIQLSVPFVDIQRIFGDFVMKDTALQVNANGTISYRTTQAAQRIAIDTIQAQPAPDSEYVALGTFTVRGFQQSINYSIMDMGIDTGLVPFFPNTSFPIDSNHIVSTSQFDFVGIHDGSLTLSITNNLPFPIDLPTPIVLRNNWTGNKNVVTTFQITDTLPQGSTRWIISSNLAGRLLYGIMTVDPLQIHTTGSNNPVRFSASDGIILSLQPTSSLEADSAYAIIPSQVVASNTLGTFTIDSNMTIKEARFKSGSFTVEIANHVDLTTQVHFEIKEFINTQTQDWIMIDTTFVGKGTKISTYAVNKYHILSTDQAAVGTYLHYSIGITLISSGIYKKLVSKNDFIQAKIRPGEPLTLESVKGNITPQYLTVDSRATAQYNLGDVKDKMQAELSFKGIKVNLRLPMTQSGVPTGDGVPIDYNNLTLVAKNSQYHDSMSITIPNGRVDPTNSVASIDFAQAPNFDAFTSYLASHFPNFPDLFFVRGQLVLNPVFNPTNSYILQDTSHVYPLIDLDMPSVMGIANGHLLIAEKIQQQIPKDFTRSVKNGTLHFAFNNGIPIAMSSSILFLGQNDSTGMRDTLLAFNPLGSITAAGVGTDSMANNPTISNITTSITGDQMDKLNKADSISIRIDLNTSGSMVKLRSTDEIKVRASVKALYIINKP